MRAIIDGFIWGAAVLVVTGALSMAILVMFGQAALLLAWLVCVVVWMLMDW
jgi:uncharacterized membrane protein